MDLSQLKPSERQIEILSPGTKKRIGVRVTLLHMSDEKLQKLSRTFQDERYRLEAKGKYFKAEQVESNLNELTFNAMTSWEFYNPTGMPGDEGYDPDQAPEWNGDKNPPFNKKTVYEVFNKLPWFRDQIGEEMGDSEAFFPL
jgi:hypothetical protein